MYEYFLVKWYFKLISKLYFFLFGFKHRTMSSFICKTMWQIRRGPVNIMRHMMSIFYCTCCFIDFRGIKFRGLGQKRFWWYIVMHLLFLSHFIFYIYFWVKNIVQFMFFYFCNTCNCVFLETAHCKIYIIFITKLSSSHILD